MLDAARTMLLKASLPERFWADAINTACYVRNRCKTKATGDHTPYEEWSGWKPTVCYLKVFGCRAFVHVPKQKRQSKLEPRAIMGIMIGYAREKKAYRIWDTRA